MLYIETGKDGKSYVQLGRYKMQLEMDDLDEISRERAKLELRETPEVVCQALVDLKYLLRAENSLSVLTDKDFILIKFLRPCKFYPESAFKLIKRFYTFKLNHPEITKDLSVASVKHAFVEEVLEIFPVRLNDGTRVLVVNSGTKWDPKSVTIKDFFRALLVLLEAATAEPKTQIAGAQIIFDMKGLTLYHIWQFNPSFAKMLVDFAENCIPVRLKAIHVINQPYIFKILFAIFKPFLGEKLRKRIFFHGSDLTSLHKKIPKEFLYPRFGGTLDIPELPGHILADLACRYENQLYWNLNLSCA